MGDGAGHAAAGAYPLRRRRAARTTPRSSRSHSSSTRLTCATSVMRRMTWGAAQAGVARGVLESVAEGTIPPRRGGRRAADPNGMGASSAAADEEAVYAANVEATRAALASSVAGTPALDDLLGLRSEPENPVLPDGKGMRITGGIRLRRLRCGLDPPFSAAWDPEPRRVAEATLVLVDTDEGLTGIGSGDTMDGFERFADLFVGRDPLEIRAERVPSSRRSRSTQAAIGPSKPPCGILPARPSANPSHTCSVERRSACPPTRPPGCSSRPISGLSRARPSRGGLSSGEAPHRGGPGRGGARNGRGGAECRRVRCRDHGRPESGWRMPGDDEPLLGYDGVRRLASALAELGVTWLRSRSPARTSPGSSGLGRERSPPGWRRAPRTPAELDAYLAADALDVYQPDAVLSRHPPRARACRAGPCKGTPVHAAHVDERDRAARQSPPRRRRRRRALP